MGVEYVHRCRGGLQALRRSPRAIASLEGLAFLALLVLPLELSPFQVLFATSVMILGLLAISVDLVWGFGGIVTVGQAAFFGIGAYATGLLSTREGWTSLLVVAPLSAAAALVCAATFGAFLFLGRKPVGFVYVALATLVLSYALESVAFSWDVVGAADGIANVPLPTVGPSALEPGPAFYYVVLGILVAVYLVFRYVTRSQFGLLLAAGSEDLERVAFFGYRTTMSQVFIFAFAGGASGLAGSLYAFHQGFVGSTLLGIALSTQAIIWVLFGGRGTLIGPLVGLAAIQWTGQSLSQSVPALWQLVLGVVLLTGIMVLPNGLISLVASERSRTLRFGRPARGSRKRGAEAPAATEAAPAVGSEVAPQARPEVARVPNVRPASANGRHAAVPQGRAVLAVEGLHKTYGELCALDGAGFLVEEAHIHGLIGPNGSGKSTMLHSISGAVPIDGGSVALKGRIITRWSSRARVSAGLSIKFQIPRVFPQLTVADNILLSLQAKDSQLRLVGSRTRGRCWGQVATTAERFGLADQLDELAGNLSHGHQQWLEIAMALAVEPHVLLLDEPTAGMSPEERHATGQLLLGIKEACSIVIVEHDLPFISSICDRVTVLHNGRVLITGTPAEVSKAKTTQEVFVSRA
jgi:branched-chain amino acid transport system permease protein